MKKNNSIRLWFRAFILIFLHAFFGVVACVALVVFIKIYVDSDGTFQEKNYLFIKILKYCLDKYFYISLSVSVLLGAVGATKVVAES